MDHAALFAAIPTPYLVMTPDLVIAEANEAYLHVVGRSREELIGRPVFEAFPPQPDALDASGVSRVQRSFERARDTGLPDTMPLQKYDIADPTTGQLVERFWSLISVPVLDDEGRTVLLLQRAEDVTDYVKERDRGQSAREQGEQWQRRIEEVEADLYARSLELQDVVAARDAAARRLASLADVALQLSSAQTVEELVAVVADRGLSALGADGGAIGVRSDDGFVRLAITASLGEGTQQDYAELPLDGPLPASVTAATGRRIVLPDLAACREWPDMEGVVAATGCQAWACLPLEVEGRLLGSLAVGWAEPHEFPPAELEVLDALAAQCSQGLERIQVRYVERRSAAAVRRMSETLQRSLLTDPPQPDHLQIAVRYRPAAEEAQVGGDWYDAFLTADGATCLVIGDVAGHDRDAAAAMGQMRNLMRGVAYTLNEPPAAVLSALDRAIRDLAVGSLATAVLARIEAVDPQEGHDPSLRRLRWSNAGHPPPLVIEADGSTRLLRTEADLLLGLDPDTDRADHEELISSGSTVLLYTDGLVERRDDASLDDGLDRLLRAAGELAGVELSELCDRLLDLLGTPGNDDIALLALRAHPEDRPRPPEAGPQIVPGDHPGSTD